MRKIAVLVEAAEDIEQARDFYDKQEPGIGDYFAASILADLESLALYHGIHAKQFGLHRRPADRFPYGIYYREAKAETEVVAFLDLRRDPGWIRSELSWRD